MLRSIPFNHHYVLLFLEVSWYAGLYLVSVGSLPHHLQAPHLVFRLTLVEPKHFLLVTQPPGGEKEREEEWERERE